MRLVLRHQLTKIVVREQTIVDDSSRTHRRAVVTGEMDLHPSHFKRGLNPADRAIHPRTQRGDSVLSLPAEQIEIKLMDGPSLVRDLFHLLLTVVAKQDHVIIIDRVRVDFFTLQDTGRHAGIRQSRPVDVLSRLVPSIPIDGSQSRDVSIRIIRREGRDVLIRRRTAPRCTRRTR